MRIAPMPTAPPTAQTARNRVGVVDAPRALDAVFSPFGDVERMDVPLRANIGGAAPTTRPRKRPRPLKPLSRYTCQRMRTSSWGLAIDRRALERETGAMDNPAITLRAVANVVNFSTFAGIAIRS